MAAHPTNCNQQNSKTTSVSKGTVLKNHSCEAENESTADEVKNVPRIKCYVCDIRVERNYLKKHLLFGRLKCYDCDTRFKDCKTFSSSRKSCSHRNVEWSKSKPPIIFLKENLRKKYLDVNKELYRYAKKLDDLQQRSPWKGVLSEIQIRKSSESIRYTEVNVCGRERSILPNKKSRKSNSSSYPESSSSKQRISKCEGGSSKRKRARVDELFGSDSKLNNKRLNKMTFGKSSIENAAESTIEFLELPADGKYLIVQKIVEECPMCYSKLKIKNSVFNVSFLFYKFFCGCGLKIFYIPNTPANIAHPVTILDTESTPLLVKKKITKHNLNKRKRQMKVKATSDLLR